MDEAVTTNKHVRTEPLAWTPQGVLDAQELADWMHRSIWVPIPWPEPNVEFIGLSIGPVGPRKYHVRSLSKQDEILWLLGETPVPLQYLPSGFRAVPRMNFEVLAKTQAGLSQVVVRLADFDVHLGGSVPLSTVLSAAQSLSLVTPRTSLPD
jgi:hypothetical protein